jgi:hypothetical protein
MVSTYPKEQSGIFILLRVLSFIGSLILYWTPYKLISVMTHTVMTRYKWSQHLNLRYPDSEMSCDTDHGDNTSAPRSAERLTCHLAWFDRIFKITSRGDEITCPNMFCMGRRGLQPWKTRFSASRKLLPLSLPLTIPKQQKSDSAKSSENIGCPTSGVAQRAMRETASHARGVSKAKQI